ncbi:O-antigen ligase [Proteus mirabilis]|uniref:O-antigen polymerase n=1 Tax=Proteus mirabilis TaxID=584 RepID=UPI001551E4C8|nr:O-antigen polymerase [Proteus mirabilis]MDM3746523.1 O-antigen ligase [Proteus mirabilis]HBC5642775.1 oligosaccharide repeat unit polymerase [Proteus mirabilis]HBC5646632.1 oligosaccharide repeat unit polymerase [Proteus mirabilis]HCK1903061.1 oligosaccharide repeat unit polymerase [Proteus mirabilis]HEJ0232406.1 oligosaccharide repeat unit polymerase [Proteus mirabilis]
MLKSQLNYFNPIIIFGLGWMFFCLLPLIYFRETSLLIILLNIVFFFSFIIGCTLSYRSKVWIRYVLYDNKFSKIKSLLSILCFIYIFVKIYLISTTEISSGNYSERYAVESQLNLYLMIFDKLFNIIFLFFLSLFAIEGKAKFYLIFALSLLSTFFEPTRLLIILTLVYWILLGVSVGYIKIRLISVILIALASPFIFSFLLIKRIYSFEGSSYDFIFHLFNLIDYDLLVSGMVNGLETFESYNALKNVINDNFIHPLSGFIRILFMIIPRTFWIDKPESVARLIAENYYPEAYQKGGGQLAGPIGDGFINAGFFGVFIIWLVLGFLSISFYKYFKRGVMKGGNIEKVYYCTFYYIYLIYFINCLRGFASDLFWVFAVNMLMLHIIKVIFFKRIQYKE